MLEGLDNYELIRQIGSGGFGEVFLYRDLTLSREVAIKRILPTYASEPDFIRRFKHEAELVARLENPYIVPLYQFWRKADSAYLVMRYIGGGNLADKLVTHGSLPPEQAANLLQKVAQALYTAHRQRVVHQDIKPANILLDADDNAYLTDFGIARDIDRNVNLAEDSNKTMHGSPKYISPEHLRRQEITFRSDIYSLGILMYEILTGAPPFESDEMLDLLQQHVRRPLPNLQEKNPALPAALNQPLIQATLKNPLERYDSVMTFAREFQEAVESTRTGGNVTIPYQGGMAVEVTGPMELINPFKSLEAFSRGDSAYFFGRDALISKLIERMTEDHPYRRFLAVVGRSGSGKSSAVKAGLLPLLQSGEIDGLPKLYISEMKPGAKPLRNLESAVLNVAARASVELMNGLASDSFELNRMLHLALPKDGDMLLVIDQFEELFTQFADESLRRNFLDILHKALTAPDSRLWVIITLRADYFAQPMDYFDWGEMMSERVEMVLPMQRDELYDAVTKPADAAGLILEDTLANQIVTDTIGQPGALPLMQYTLYELFQYVDGIELTLNAYRDLGGINGSLVKRANQVYRALTPEQQVLTQVLFSQLVKVGQQQDHTRRRIRWRELYNLPEGRDGFAPLLEAFGNYRLLTFDYDTITREPTVEIAHEALIRSWNLLLGWLNENADALRLKDRLAVDVAAWHDNGEDSSYLATGRRLGNYAELEHHRIVRLSKREQDYLQESLKQENERQQRDLMIRRAFQVGAAVLAVLLVVAVIGWFNTFLARNAEAIARGEAEDNADLARAGELAVSSLLYRETYPDRAMLLSLQSLAVENTFAGRNALLNSLLSQPRLQHYYYGHDTFVRAVAVNSDGTRLASGDSNGQIILWNTTERDAQPLAPVHEDRINSVTFKPDGSQIASADGSGRVVIQDVSTIRDPISLNHDSAIRSLAYSPDGMWLATAGFDGTITLYDTSDYTADTTINAHDGLIYDLDFSPDGAFLASAGEDTLIQLWRSDTWEQEATLSGHTNWVLALAFSPDGSRLVSSSADLSVRMWDIASADLNWGFRNHEGFVTSVAFSDDGRFVISGDTLAAMVIWQASNGAVLSEFDHIGQAEVRQIVTSGNDMWIASDSNTLVQLDIGFEPPLGQQVLDNSEPIQALAVSDTTGVIAYSERDASGDDFAIQLQQADTSQLLVFHENTVVDLAFSGSRLVSAGLDQALALWENGERIGDHTLDDGTPFSVAVHNDIVALGLGDGRIELWTISDPQNWTRRDTLRGHEGRVTELAFNADGTRLLSASLDETARLWNTANAGVLHIFSDHTDAVEAVAFSPDSTIIASAGRDRVIRLWDSATGANIGRLDTHDNWVNSLAFSPDGRLLASASADRSVILWDVNEGRMLGQPLLGHQDWVTEIAFEADGQTLISVGRDGALFRWQIALDTWIERACTIADRSLNDDEVREFFSDTAPPVTVCST